jgi:hypothetical protein
MEKYRPPPGFFFLFLLIPRFSPLIHFCSVLVLFRPFMSLTVHNRLFTTQYKHPCPRWDFFFFLLIPGFSPLIHFVLFKSFRPSCHFTFHITVLTTNTTQTSMPPVGFKPKILVSERPKTHALDRAATVIGTNCVISVKRSLLSVFFLLYSWPVVLLEAHGFL